MEMMKEKGDEAFYDKMDSAYPTDEEDSEVINPWTLLVLPKTASVIFRL